MRIDSHQHFWLFDPVKDAWINEDMQVIRRNFLPNDISQTLKDNQVMALSLYKPINPTGKQNF